MFKFKFRAECLLDASRMFNYVSQINFSNEVFQVDFRVSPVSSWKKFPDVTGEFECGLTLTELKEEIRINCEENDLHVLYESLNYAEDYDGERLDKREDKNEIKAPKFNSKNVIALPFNKLALLRDLKVPAREKEINKVERLLEDPSGNRYRIFHSRTYEGTPCIAYEERGVRCGRFSGGRGGFDSVEHALKHLVENSVYFKKSIEGKAV